MTNLRKLGMSFTLIAVLFTAAFAGETNAPPCVPGETNAPPCSSQSQNDDSALPGEIQSPPVSNTVVDVTDIAETLLWSLLLF